MAWCFADEATPETSDLLARMRVSEAIVPAIWPSEVANVLLICERRQRLTQAQAAQFIQLLHTLAITVDAESAMDTLGSVITLGREYSLTAYNAAYLELAMRQGVPLATLDVRLRAAVTRAGVPIAL